MQNLVELRFRKTNKLNRKNCFPKFCTSPSAGTLCNIFPLNRKLPILSCFSLFYFLNYNLDLSLIYKIIYEKWIKKILIREKIAKNWNRVSLEKIGIVKSLSEYWNEKIDSWKVCENIETCKIAENWNREKF